ncbi:MAG: HIT family protein [Sinobacterium sp.]|nr:HIT family protein [Sinobacterium sp.]
MATVFTQIIQGDIPGSFVYEDEQAVAIMTIQPAQTGHVLVIPREEIDHFDDVPAELAAHLMNLSQKIAKAIKQAYPCERVALIIAGLEVPHTHLHLIPINAMEDMSFAGLEFADGAAVAQAAENIKQYL